MCIFLFLSADFIFSTLTTNTIEKLKFGKKINNNFFCNCPTFDFDKKNYNLFPINDICAQITFSYSL